MHLFKIEINSLLDCKTVQGKDCVFPFKYKGTTYSSCTQAESSNGAAWCATEVDTDGVVVNNKWQDCDGGCPGTDFPCNENFLFNIEGTCVNGTQASGLLRNIQQAKANSHRRGELNISYIECLHDQNHLFSYQKIFCYCLLFIFIVKFRNFLCVHLYFD